MRTPSCSHRRWVSAGRAAPPEAISAQVAPQAAVHRPVQRAPGGEGEAAGQGPGAMQDGRRELRGELPFEGLAHQGEQLGHGDHVGDALLGEHAQHVRGPPAGDVVDGAPRERG